MVQVVLPIQGVFDSNNGQLSGVTPLGGSSLTPIVSRVIGGSPVDVVIFGNSYGNYENYPDGIGGNAVMTGGLWHFLISKCGYQKVNIINKAVIGNTVDDMLARFEADVLNSTAKIVLMDLGANDFYALGFTAAYVLPKVLSMVNRAVGVGKFVFLAESPVQGTGRTNYTTAKQKEALSYNLQLKQQSVGIKGFTVLPLVEYMRDPSDYTEYAPLTNMIGTDGIHISMSTGIRFGIAHYQKVDVLLPNIPVPFSPSGGFGISGNSLLAAGVGQFAGSGGTLGTNASGSVPSNWTLQGTANAAVVGSFVDDIGGRWFEMAATVSGQGTQQQCSFFSSSVHSRVSVGDVLQMIGEMQLDPGAASVVQFESKIYAYDGTLLLQAHWNQISNGYVPLTLDTVNVNTIWPFRTNPLTMIGNTKTAVQVYFYLNVLGTGTAKLRARNVDLYKL